MDAEPHPVVTIDEHIRGSLRDYQRARWLAVTALIAVLCAAVITLGVLYIQADGRLTASCGFWRTLVSLPVTAAPDGRPSKLGITIVVGARGAYDGQGCGKLPAADPSVTKWAPFYHVRIP